jgi:hypothetical protein
MTMPVPRKFTREQIEKAKHLLRTAPTVTVTKLTPNALNDVAKATGLTRRAVIRLRTRDLEHEDA